MTNEEIQKLVEFIITQQANANANIAILTTKLETLTDQVSQLTKDMQISRQVLDFVS